MAFYAINWTKFGTALIEADNEDEAIEYLQYEIDFEEAEVECIFENKPYSLSLYDPISIG